MSRQYRMAIVGVGAVAEMHAVAMSHIPSVELVAASCRTQPKGETFAAKWKCHWFADSTTMLDQAKPDVVTICTPSGAHLDPTLECAKRGIHVLSEKPLEISTARVDAMIAAADAGSIRLGGIFPQRFNPVMQTVREAAAQGRFGDVSAVAAYVPWWRDDAYYAPSRWQGTLELDGGGALMNQSIHMIDALQWIAAATMPALDPDENPVAQVFAYTAKRGHDPSLIEVEDTGVVVLKLRSGALGQILGATSFYPGFHRRLQIAGRNGTAEIEEDRLSQFTFREPQPEDDAIRARFSQQSDSHGGAGNPMAFSHANHQRNIAAFIESIDTGRPFELNPLEARKAIAILEAIYESAAKGKPVAVKPAPRPRPRRHRRVAKGLAKDRD